MKKSDEFFDLLRAHGLRKKVAKSVAALDGNRQRAGAKGERLARETADGLNEAADEIRRRVLRTDRKRSQAGRKAAQTRKRNSAKRRTSARQGARTRAANTRRRTTKRTRS
jgi:hypothetical protein